MPLLSRTDRKKSYPSYSLATTPCNIFLFFISLTYFKVKIYVEGIGSKFSLEKIKINNEGKKIVVCSSKYDRKKILKLFLDNLQKQPEVLSWQ